MERAIQIFAVVQCLSVGLSHLVAPRAWAEFFILVREKGALGVFAIAFLYLYFGSIIVAFHPVWSGLPLVLTLLGVSQVVKATLYFCVPSWGMRGLRRVSLERAWEFQVASVVLLAIGGVILFHLVRTA